MGQYACVQIMLSETKLKQPNWAQVPSKQVDIRLIDQKADWPSLAYGFEPSIGTLGKKNKVA